MQDFFGQWWGTIPQGTLRGLSEVGITTHWIILQFSIGILTVALITEALAYWLKDKDLLKMARTYTKLSVVIFAVGSATGSLSEFGLLLFWPGFLELVGKYYFIPLYLEVFAFMAEVVFVYMYYYTWKRVTRKKHLFMGFMAVLGLWASSLLIMTVNTLMSYPPGLIQTYNPSQGVWTQPAYRLYLPDGTQTIMTTTEIRNVIAADPSRYHAILNATLSHEGVYGIVFNSPIVLISAFHAIFAGVTVTIFSILGVYMWRYLKFRGTKLESYYVKGIKYQTVMGTIFLVIEGIFGHYIASYVSQYNPEKLAAIEGTKPGILSPSNIPFIDQFVRFLAYGDPNKTILPYNSIPSNFQPPLILVYFYYIKIMLASLLFLNVLLLMYFIFRKKYLPKILVYINLTLPLWVQLISNFGWIVREAGRKPWTIYGILSVDEAARKGPVPTWVFVGVFVYSFVLLSVLFGLIYIIFRMKNIKFDESDDQNDKIKRPKDKLSTKIEVILSENLEMR